MTEANTINIKDLSSSELFDLAQRGNAQATDELALRAAANVNNIMARELTHLLNEPTPTRTDIFGAAKSLGHRLHLPGF